MEVRSIGAVESNFRGYNNTKKTKNTPNLAHKHDSK